MVFGVAEVLHGDKRYLSMPDKAFWWTPVFAGLVSSLPDTARLTLLGLRPLKIMFASLPRKMARKPQTKLLVPSFIPPSKWTNWRTQFNKIYCLRASLGQGEGFICIYIYICHMNWTISQLSTFTNKKHSTSYSWTRWQCAAVLLTLISQAALVRKGFGCGSAWGLGCQAWAALATN